MSCSGIPEMRENVYVFRHLEVVGGNNFKWHPISNAFTSPIPVSILISPHVC